MRWLIWSNEHQGWWLQSRCGYSPRFWDAGKFSRAEAESIVRQANIAVGPDDPPNEIMVPAAPPAEIEERMG